MNIHQHQEMRAGIITTRASAYCSSELFAILISGLNLAGFVHEDVSEEPVVDEQTVS